jgi:hypothetical protein
MGKTLDPKGKGVRSTKIKKLNKGNYQNSKQST